MATTAVLWQMMYRIQDWFIHLLLILSTVYEHDQQKTIVYQSDEFVKEKVNKIRNFTVIAYLNVAQKKI